MGQKIAALESAIHQVKADLDEKSNKLVQLQNEKKVRDEMKAHLAEFASKNGIDLTTAIALLQTK